MICREISINEIDIGQETFRISEEILSPMLSGYPMKNGIARNIRHSLPNLLSTLVKYNPEIYLSVHR
jgi:hypothetical protein